MIGKLKIKDDTYCITSKVDFDLHPDVVIKETTKDDINSYGFLWVDFEVETIAVGNDEFDVTDKDVAIIKKLYDNDFGTMRESLSKANYRHNKNKYPVGGFAPGFYTKTCVDCKNYFVGDKRAAQCEICAYEEFNGGILDLKGKLNNLTEYYSKLLKVSIDPNYRGNNDSEIEKIKNEINEIKNKIKNESE